MMELLERVFLLIIGGCGGYILARIVDRLRKIEEKVDHMDEDYHRDHNEGGFMEIRYLKDFLYLLVLVIVIAGLVRSEKALNQSEENAKNAEITRCEGGQENRDAQRDIVDAVYSLALGFTIQDNDDPPRTTQEEQELTAYLAMLDNFRDSTYAKIQPTELCAPYVTDDEQKPEPITLDDLLKKQGEQNG